MRNLLFYTIIISIFSCGTSNSQKSEIKSVDLTKVSVEVPTSEVKKITKSVDEWKKELNEMEYYVLREEGTERAFTGDLLNNKDAGIYVCRACQLPLFSSNTKFKSGTGWPSFYEPLNEFVIEEEVDLKYGMKRIEVHCARCGGHQGHVFNDGPKPTGLRYCINAVSLDFVKEDDKP